jgi:hypothetical protein
MQTNCFEEGPAGLRDNIGLSWLPEQKGAAGQQKPGSGKIAANDSSSRTRKTGTTGLVGCHVRQFGRSGSTSRQGGGEWQEKTKW